MRAIVEIEENVVTARLLAKEKKDERLYKSLVIVGQADGTLVYFDASGHIHVVHGTGPQARGVLEKAGRAILQITQGMEAIAALGAAIS